MAEEAQSNPSVPPSVPGEPSAQSQATEAVVHSCPHAAPQPFPLIYPSLFSPSQIEEQNNHGQGLYAVQISPFMGMMPEYAPGMLIPLTYKIPTRTNSSGGEGAQEGGVRQQQQNGGAQNRQIVVRRFQFAFHLDLALLLKLAFAVILFGQEGSRQRFVILVFFASLIYLYQTGVMTPFIRYLQRGLVPARRPPPPPPARQQNAPVAPVQNDHQHDNGGNENENNNQNGAEAVGVADDNNQQQQQEGEEAGGGAGRANGINLWGIAREIQTFVVGFITSLLPGFDHND